jgi:hypothetical protein
MTTSIKRSMPAAKRIALAIGGSISTEPRARSRTQLQRARTSLPLARPVAELRSNLRDEALARSVRRVQPFEALIGFERSP